MPYPLKLTPDAAKEMRLLRATMRLSYATLGEMFEIHESNAAKVCHGLTHPDAGGPIEELHTTQYWNRRHHPEHGEQSKYQAGCRCDLCSKANSDRCKEWRKRVRYGTSRR